jgi:hypothetical protein
MIFSNAAGTRSHRWTSKCHSLAVPCPQQCFTKNLLKMKILKYLFILLIVAFTATSCVESILAGEDDPIGHPPPPPPPPPGG